MEISGSGPLATPGLNVAEGSFNPSNNNSALSPDFVSAVDSFGQEQIDSGAAPAGSDPMALFLEAMTPSLLSMINIAGFDFSSAAE